MIQAFLQLNHLAVWTTALVGFLLGWLWFGPLCGRAWMAEMKFTELDIAAAKPRMARLFALGFLFTLLATYGLALLITAHRSPGWLKGAEFGALVGALVVGARILNGALWENRSTRLQAIVVGYEIVLFTLQGAIFGVWR